MTYPGFASRNTGTTFRQFPQRDGAVMADIEGMNTPGWSNQNADEAAGQVQEKVVDSSSVEDKAVTKTTTARKTAPKKG